MRSPKGHPTVKPAFLDVWPTEPWRVIAANARADDQTLAREAGTNAEQMIRGAVQRELKERLISYGHSAILPVIANELGVALEPGPAQRDSDQGMLEAMCSRDLAHFFVQGEHWRAALSYRQLVQSRQWARELSDPTFDEFRTQVCAIEEGIKALSVAIVNDEFEPWLYELVAAGAGDLSERVSGQSTEALEAVTLEAVLDELSTTVLEDVAKRYNSLPSIKRRSED